MIEMRTGLMDGFDRALKSGSDITAATPNGQAAKGLPGETSAVLTTPVTRKAGYIKPTCLQRQASWATLATRAMKPAFLQRSGDLGYVDDEVCCHQTAAGALPRGGAGDHPGPGLQGRDGGIGGRIVSSR